MAKRQSLATFSPKAAPPAIDGGKVIAAIPAAPEKSPTKAKHISVYLEPHEKRTLKLLSIDTETPVSEICAQAIREWMERNGHARTGKIKSDA